MPTALPIRQPETVALNGLPQYLQQLGAQGPHPQSPPHRHIYYASSLDAWVEVTRHGQNARLAFFATCPCGD